MKSTSFRAKTFDTPIPMVKTSAKIKKLKKMFREKQEEQKGLAVYNGNENKEVTRVEERVVVLAPRGEGFDPNNFDPKTLLNNELMEIVDLLHTARTTYRDLPDGENATSLSMLLREMRGFVGDLYQMTKEDKDTVFKKIDEEIVQPFLKKVVKGVVNELDSIRKQLLMSFGEEKGADITSAVKVAGRNIAPIFSAEYAALRKDIAKALGVDDIKPIVEKLDNINFPKKES